MGYVFYLIGKPGSAQEGKEGGLFYQGFSASPPQTFEDFKDF